MRPIATALVLALLTASPALAQCVDINTAGSDELQRIIHIGPERAQQIIELREQRAFRSVDELVRVRGIAAARLRDIKAQGLACVGSETANTDVFRLAGSQEVNPCTVARVVDGDTLDCADGRRIRLLLIDAPEMDQEPFAPLAKQALEDLAPLGTELGVETDVQLRDRYRRLLAYLLLEDGRMVNEELLRMGVAVVSVYPPNVRHVERFRAAVEEARRAGAGLWAVDAFECLPADHRAGRCEG